MDDSKRHLLQRKMVAGPMRSFASLQRETLADATEDSRLEESVAPKKVCDRPDDKPRKFASETPAEVTEDGRIVKTLTPEKAGG